MLRAMPKLRWVQKMGAGVDDLLPHWPPGTPVLLTRTDGRLIAPRMTEYVLWAILARTLRTDVAGRFRDERRWGYFEIGSVRQHTVGVAGVGEIGSGIARALRALGARVAGWRRTRAGCECVDELFCGDEQLRPFLAACSIVVLALPLTSATRRAIDASALAALRPDAHLINVGRGGVVDERALLEAIERGRLAHATLDVFESEPLPPDHPFWTHPRVTLTPHVSGPLIPEDIVPHFLDNVRAFDEGRPLRNVVNMERQY